MFGSRPRRKKGTDRSTEPGQDSFLDVVANLIGILIILVMLIGSQAQSVWERLRADNQEEDATVQKLKQKVAAAQTSVGRLKSENRELEVSIAHQKAAESTIRRERDQIQLAVHAMEETLEARKSELSREDQEKQRMISTVSFLRDQLDSVKGRTASLSANAKPAGVIEHLPTPIAKTVFGEEVHFRLLNGRLAHVPLDDLIVLMKSEWKVKAKKLVQTPSTVETVGPVGNFRLQYKLVLREQVQRTDHGMVRSIVPGLDRFVVLPIREDIGEPFEEAMQPGSEFSKRIASLDPDGTTISIWVYPDSFGMFNQLKKTLFQKGFLSAGWPLSKNQPISGSPNGFRTAAQ